MTKISQKTKKSQRSMKKQTNRFSDADSLKLVKEKSPFLTFRTTEQTVYWSIILLLITIFVVWIIVAQSNIMDIVNSTIQRLVF